MPKLKYIRSPESKENNRLYARRYREIKTSYIEALQRDNTALRHENVSLSLENSQLRELLSLIQ